MVEIVYLDKDNPPEDQDTVLVERAVSGKYVNISSVGTGKAVAVLQQGPYASFAEAIDSAVRHAAQKGIPIVYAKGVPLAERT